MSRQLSCVEGPPRVVIAGGGVAALEALAGLHALARGLVDIVLVTPDAEFRYRALDPGERFGRAGSIRQPVDRIAAAMGTVVVCDALERVAAAEHRIVLGSGRTLAYDMLIVAVGAQTYPAFANGISLDLPTWADALDELIEDLDDGRAPAIAVIVPDGVTWTLPAYEVALQLRARARELHMQLDLLLVTPEIIPVAAFGVSVSRAVAGVLAAAGIDVHTSSLAIVLSDGALMSRGRWITVSRIVALPRIAGPRVHGLPCDTDGFIEVDDHRRVPGAPDVYAAGDGTIHPLKQGGLAAQQADRVATEVARRAGANVPSDAEQEVLRAILTTPDGPLFLAAELSPTTGELGALVSSSPLWEPPTKVATRWLGPLLQRLQPSGEQVAA